jgi:hypothetical protein
MIATAKKGEGVKPETFQKRRVEKWKKKERGTGREGGREGGRGAAAAAAARGAGRKNAKIKCRPRSAHFS